jgi:hypothetical protein
METCQDSIMADTATHCKLSFRPQNTAEGKRLYPPSRKLGPRTLPSSPFGDPRRRLSYGCTTTFERRSSMDDFASAVKAGQQFKRERYGDAVLSFRKLFCARINPSPWNHYVRPACFLFEVGMIHAYSQNHDS